MTSTTAAVYSKQILPGWRPALVLTLGLRLFYSAAAAIFAFVLPVNLSLIRSNALTEKLPLPSHSLHYLLLDIWMRFDTLWYLLIAQSGYARPAAIVFYPLYPALIRTAAVFMEPIAAALLISTISTFFLFWGLQKLLLLDFPAEQVQRAFLICVLWPASFIYFAGYAESLLFALFLWSLYAARRNWWLGASILGCAATLTKAAGILIFVPLLVLAVRRRSLKAWPILMVPWGSVGFLFWLQQSGRSMSSIYLTDWHTTFSLPWITLWASFQMLFHSPDIVALNLFFLFLCCWLIFMSHADLSYLLYSAAAILLFLMKHTTPPLQSMIRYLLIVFPVYIGLAHCWNSPRLKPKLGSLCAVLFIANLGLMGLFLEWSLVL